MLVDPPLHLVDRLLAVRRVVVDHILGGILELDFSNLHVERYKVIDSLEALAEQLLGIILLAAAGTLDATPAARVVVPDCIRAAAFEDLTGFSFWHVGLLSGFALPVVRSLT